MQHKPPSRDAPMRRVPLYPCGHRYGPNYGHLANKRFNLDNRASPADRERIRVCGFQHHHSVRYSINSSPFATPSPNNGTSTQINTTEYRLSAQPSPGAQYAIRFKAWSDAGACAENDVNITVTGAATTTVANIDDLPNADPPNEASTDQDVWFYVWDSNTDCCMESDTSSYTVSSPALDGQSRLYYVDWIANSPSGTPGERYSLNFGDNVANESKTHFIYDTYIIRAIRKPGRPACGITYRLRFILPGMEMFITISLLWTGKQRSSPEYTAIPHEAGHGRRVCCR